MVVDITAINESAKNKTKDAFDSMNRKQEEVVSKRLMEDFGHVLKDYKEIFSKLPKKLKDSAFNSSGSFRKSYDGFYMQIDSFDNYIWAGFAKGKENDKAFINSLINEMKSDLQNLKSTLQAKCPDVKIDLLDEDAGFSLNDYISTVRKYNNCSNGIELYAIVPKSKCMKYIPSDSDIKENEKKKYIELYDEYAKFMSHPSKLSGKFWAGHLNDISRIIGMSAETFNSIVSKNIGQVSGKPINGSMFENDPEWGKSMQKKLGNCVDLGWFSDADQLLYSIPNKKVYWANYEHTDLEIFFNDFPYNSKEFEDVLYDNESEKKEIRDLFKARDTEKGYGLIK